MGEFDSMQRFVLAMNNRGAVIAWALVNLAVRALMKQLF